MPSPPRIAPALGALALCTVSFLLGMWWYKHQLLESGPLRSTAPLLLSGVHGEPGRLPAGTVFYPYAQGPSINTYVVFVNTKHTPLLEPVAFERYLTVSPIEAHAELDRP